MASITRSIVLNKRCCTTVTPIITEWRLKLLEMEVMYLKSGVSVWVVVGEVANIVIIREDNSEGGSVVALVGLPPTHSSPCLLLLQVVVIFGHAGIVIFVVANVIASSFPLSVTILGLLYTEHHWLHS